MTSKCTHVSLETIEIHFYYLLLRRHSSKIRTFYSFYINKIKNYNEGIEIASQQGEVRLIKINRLQLKKLINTRKSTNVLNIKL